MSFSFSFVYFCGRCLRWFWLGWYFFSHSSWYESMFWIWAENSVDSIEVFLLLLSSADTKSFSDPHHPPWLARKLQVHKEFEGGAQPEQLTPSDPRDIPYHIASASACTAGGRRKKGGTFQVVTFLFSKHCYMWQGPALQEMAEALPAHEKGGWTPACPWEGVNDYLVLLSLREQLSFHLLNCLYLNHMFSSFYCSNSFPHPIPGGLREWVWDLDGGWDLTTTMLKESFLSSSSCFQ